jgi:hypothetical protein
MATLVGFGLKTLDRVVHEVVAVHEHVAEPHYPLVLAHPPGGLGIVAPEAPDRLADDLQIPLHALA